MHGETLASLSTKQLRNAYLSARLMGLLVTATGGPAVLTINFVGPFVQGLNQFPCQTRSMCQNRTHQAPHTVQHASPATVDHDVNSADKQRHLEATDTTKVA